MKSRHCDEGSNHITFIDSDYKIASFLAMTEWQQKLSTKKDETIININSPFA